MRRDGAWLGRCCVRRKPPPLLPLPLAAYLSLPSSSPSTSLALASQVIDQMSARSKDMRGVTWQVMNVMQLAFADGAFDAVVDKGTLDSLLCGDNSTANGGRYLSEVSRVLKPGGVFFCVSYGTPDNRLQYFENDDYGWSVVVKTLPKPTISSTTGAPDAADPASNHFVYVLVKGGGGAGGGAR